MGHQHNALRIQSDGTGKDTVVTLDDGSQVDNVTGAVIWLEANDVNRVSLDIIIPVIDAHAHVDEINFQCPVCAEKLTHVCKGSIGDPNSTMSGA